MSKTTETQATEPEQSDVSVELPSAENNPVTAAEQATTATLEAMETVKTMEVQTLTNVLETLNTILDKVQDLHNQALNMFQEAESYRAEAIDIMETLMLKEEQDEQHKEESSGDGNENENKPNNSNNNDIPNIQTPTTRSLKQALKNLL